MNKTLETKLVESFTEIQSWVNTTKDFVAEQAPLVVQEVIRWGLYQHIFWASLSCFLLIVGLYTCYRAFKYSITFNWEQAGDVAQVSSIILSVSSPVWSVIWFCNMTYSLYQVTYISVAPRLYVLEQLAGLLNKANG